MSPYQVVEIAPTLEQVLSTPIVTVRSDHAKRARRAEMENHMRKFIKPSLRHHHAEDPQAVRRAV